MEVGQIYNLVKQMGPAWAAYRAGYSIKQQIGWFERRFQMTEWSAYRLADLAPGLSPDHLLGFLNDEAAGKFFINTQRRERYRGLLAETLPDPIASKVVDEVKAARRGAFYFFSAVMLETSWPPRWHRHPETGNEWPRIHWSRLSDLGSSDVKWLWEMGRFNLAYTIVRACWLTGDGSHAEIFWQMAESFKRANPPNCGAHWMCGQECAIRVLAWCFALFGLLDAPATTPERAAMLVEMIAAHGERIEGNLGYAVSQKNNHAVNEALALFTLGTTLPMLKASPRWEARGREVLEQAARRQIYDDGAYIQHSMNYHRLVLQSYAWAIRLAELSGEPLSEHLRERTARAARLLYQLTDEQSGRTPNYGSNDGATLFRLDSCEFEDYRPALALAFWAAERRRIFPGGVWDEPLLWLYGEEPFEKISDPQPRIDLAAEQGGYYTLREKETWGLIRCCRYEDRPAQADMLHLDLWWKGANLLADPGTYSYNGAPPWNNGLAGTGAHNAVQIDWLDQMERGPRFTWFYWNRGRVIRRVADDRGQLKLFEAEHDGYERRLKVTHRRAVLLIAGKLWVIVDDITGGGTHHLSSHWLFPKAEVESRSNTSLKLRNPAGAFDVQFFDYGSGQGALTPELKFIEASTDTVLGWFSTRYFNKEPALSVVADERCHLPARRITVISLVVSASVELVSETELEIALGEDHFSAEWATLPYVSDQSLVRSARLNGAQNQPPLMI
jgi:heparinase II/III-like protein